MVAESVMLISCDGFGLWLCLCLLRLFLYRCINFNSQYQTCRILGFVICFLKLCTICGLQYLWAYCGIVN